MSAIQLFFAGVFLCFGALFAVWLLNVAPSAFVFLVEMAEGQGKRIMWGSLLAGGLLVSLIDEGGT